MTDLLLRLFIKATPEDAGYRSSVARLSGVLGILCNTALFVLKLIVGTLSGSVSITADAMNNLSDASSAIVTLIGFKLAEKPADANHPYGHARYEYLSGLAVAGLIVVIGFELARTSVEKILFPSPVAMSLPVFLVLAVSILMKLGLARLNRDLGERISSTTLAGTAVDSRNDAISTAAVLFAALVETLTHWQIDGAMGLLVAIFILYSGCALAKETISPLLGQSASPELRQSILDTVSSDPRILGYHDLMVHDYGPGQRFASIHVEMDQREDPLHCHELIDDLERQCLAKHKVHLVIHYDPVVVGDPEQDRLRNLVSQLLYQRHPRFHIHDFRMVTEGEGIALSFDAALPGQFLGQQAEIQTSLEHALTAIEGKPFRVAITFDPEAFDL